MTVPGKHPNILNEDKFINRIRNVIEVARIEQDLTGSEVVGALTIAMLEVFLSLPKEEINEDDEDESQVTP